MNDQLYSELNKAWKSTCRVILGDEIGELKDCENWLSEFLDRKRTEKSAISQKEVCLPLDDYCNEAKFIRFDEIDFNKRFEPLNINEIKDIDGALNAIRERTYYAGNIVLGNSKCVEGSSNVTDGTYVYNSFFVDECQNVACSSNIKASKNAYGVNYTAFVDHVIRSLGVGPRGQRLFESYWVLDASDIYYSANIDGCNECLFCFNLRGRRNNIGNLQLQKDKYVELKKKLIAEMLEHARKGKTSLIGLLTGLPKGKPDIDSQPLDRGPFDIRPVQEAFDKTYRIIFKRDPGELDSYSRYLRKRRIPEVVDLKDTASKETIQFCAVPGFEFIPKHRIISESEAAAISKNPISLTAQEVDELSLNGPTALSKIGFTIIDSSNGKNHNVGRTLADMNTVNCYQGMAYVESKNCGYCIWPRESSHIFGSTQVFNSSFCIKSYYSNKLNRAFEADSCTNCSDIYFAHNCENVHNSMFCFNVKNIRNAIGNAELPQEQYKKVKDTLVEQIADELANKKDLRWDIYNIGCYKG